MQEWLIPFVDGAELHRMAIEQQIYASSSALSTPTPAPFFSTSPFSEATAEGTILSPKTEESAEENTPLALLPSRRSSIGSNKTGDSPPRSNEPRKRGRPRKYPVQLTQALTKPTKGRSKTGCLTCRRRKKKCDETKPICLNCQKNAVVCEGYQPKEVWKSGRQKEENDTLKQNAYQLPRSLPSLIDGIETPVDRRFLDHYAFTLSRLLTLVKDDTNPHKSIILPMAMHSQGLMHAVLSLAGAHLSGLTSDQALHERSEYHFWECVSRLRSDILSHEIPQDEIEPTVIASTLTLCLKCICEGQTNGEYRHHMDAARRLLAAREPRDREFAKFAIEFFQYNDISNSLTSLDRRPMAPVQGMHSKATAELVVPGFYIGIEDGLYNQVNATTSLRDEIRLRLQKGQKPPVDYEMMTRAMEIDEAIREWSPPYPPGTEYWFAGQVYRQTLWVYLYRTIYIVDKRDKIIQAVDHGLDYFERLPPDSGANSVLSSPLFLLGCSSFTEPQRERIRRAYAVLKAYIHKRNLDVGLSVMERIWRVMDTNIAEAWDWQQMIATMGIDFLAT